MKKNIAITTLVAITLAGCGGTSEEAEVEEESVETEVEEISEPPCTGSDCRGRLPLLLATPAEFDRDDIEGQKCKLRDSLWQLTDDPDDPPICATRGQAIWAVEHGESGPRAGRAVTEPVETEPPTTVATTTTTTTTTEPPPSPTRKASAPLDNTEWYVPGGIGQMSSDHSRFTLDETGEVHIEWVTCRSKEFCFSWEQDGENVKIYSHTGSGLTLSGTVGPGHIITGTARVGTFSSDPLDNLGKSPQEVLEDNRKAIGWSWGAVWCPEGGDCPPGDAEEMLSQYVDLP